MKSSIHLKISFSVFLIFICFAFNAFGQITADKTSGCLPLVVAFEIEDYDFETVYWNIGNGQTSTADQPTFIFEEAGEFSVKAIVTHQSGTVDTLHYEEVIVVNEKPQVDFSIGSANSCVGESISFNNETTQADTYLWTFGDGNQSTDENPLHQYQEAGVYTVSLTASVNNSCQEVKVLEDAIEINEVGEVEISSSRRVQCLSDVDPIEFSVSGDIAQAEWDFGDGISKEGLSVNHLYTSPGEYEVNLNYTSNSGCNTTVRMDSLISVEEIAAPEITVSDPTVCLGQEVTLNAVHADDSGFEWEINGSSHAGKELTLPLNQAGDVELKLTYTNSAGCVIEVFENDLIYVQEVDLPNIEFGQVSGCEPFDFSATNKTLDGVNFSWKVNDEIIEGANLNYTFEQHGNYTIIGITEYESGCKIETEVGNGIQVFKKETKLDVSEWQGCAPFTTELTLLNDGASEVNWNIAGEQLIGETISFEFENPGIYYPKISYINEQGCNTVYEFESPITVLDREIHLDDPEIIESCTSTEVYFSGNMGYDFWEWDFGDGNTSNDRNPVHSYDEAGTYEVSLKTNNKNGCETTLSKYNIINIPDLEVQTSLEVTKGDDCGYFSVKVKADLKEWQTAKWFYNESVIGTDSELEVSFISLSDIGLTLSIGSAGECTKSKAIMIPNPWEDCEDREIEEEMEEPSDDSPIGNFQFSSCDLPYSVDIVNPLPDARKIQWRFSDGRKHSKTSFIETFNQAGEHIIGYWAKLDNDSTILVEDYIKVTLYQSEIDFDYEIEKVCNGFKVLLSPENPEFENYRWKLNNELIELSADGSYFIEEEGLYSISLSAESQNSCATTKIKNLFVGNEENQFTYPKTLCLGEEFVVEHNLQGFESVKWDMGNGEIIGNFNTPYVYSTAGEYQIKAIASDFEGCESVFDFPQKTSVKDLSAAFNVNKNTGCGETVIQFKNQSTEANEWFWDFGNGITSTEENPEVTFLPGSYSVTLTASNGECSRSTTKPGFIKIDELRSDFSFEYDQECLPVVVQFTDESVNASSWFWDFGDGHTSTEQNPTHTFVDHPNSEVKLTVENGNGCSTFKTAAMDFIFIASFKADKNAVCLGNGVQFSSLNEDATDWFWDFGDGNSSTEKNPLHHYESPGVFDVKLIAEYSSGCTDTVLMEQYIEVFSYNADFKLVDTLDSKCVPVQVSFQNLSVGAVSYFWDFGDGNISTVRNPVHLYDSLGNFDVTLVITNELGCQDTLRKEQLVSVSGPETKFEIESKVVCLPNTANFTDVSANAVKWKWVFGDGNISTEQHPQHLYESPGIYKVTLIAENEEGCEQIYSMDNVKVLPTPDVNFDMEVSGECYPVEVKLTNRSHKLLNPTYLWKFGDGQTSTAENPNILIESTGRFDVTLTVTNDRGCPVSFTHDDQVLVRDTAQHIEADLNKILVENNKVHFELSSYDFNNVSHYNVYRDSNTGYNLLQTIEVEGGSSQRIIYDDQSCNPQNKSHQYIFQAVRFCENTVSKERLTVFNTMHLKKQPEREEVREINWNQSKGFPIDNQRIFRKLKEEEQWQEIAVVTSGAMKFRDEEDLCPGIYQYKVGAFEQNTLRSVSSDVEFELTDEIYRNQIAEIENTTVMETGEVFTEWSIPEEGKARITAFEIYRSENGGEFEYFDSVEPHEQFYIDEESDTENNTYTYQVTIVNDCSIDTESSDASNTVLLQKDVQFRKYELKWNAFKGWEEGVEKYIIQSMDENGNWKTIEEVSGDQLKATVKDTDH